MTVIRFFTPLWVAMILVANPASAQSPATRAARPAVTASLVPIGANSDAYWTGDGPGMRAVALDPDAAPPATLCVRRRGGGFQTIPGILNRPSIALPVTAGLLRVFASQQVVEKEDPPLFGSFNIPATAGHYDIFLNRSDKQKGWENAESMVLSANPADYPPGALRAINLSALAVKLKINSEVLDLAPRSTKIIPSGIGETAKLVPVLALRTSDQETQWIIRTGIRMSADLRANLVIFPGREAKKPCKATWYYQSEPESDQPDNPQP
jgi:hypothetical protein